MIQISLPEDLESRVKASVHTGRFASMDDAMAEAARLLLRDLDRAPGLNGPETAGDTGPDAFLGSMRDAADELDGIVADAYRERREETWRDLSVEQGIRKK